MKKDKKPWAISKELHFSGDKSLSHRAAIFAAMAKGVSEIKNFLPGEDTLNTLSVFESLGTKIEKKSNTHYLLDSGGMQAWSKSPGTLNVGNSGTSARLLMGLLAGREGVEAVLDGDESLRKRPMKRVMSPLEKFGASIENKETLPLRISGKKIRDIDFTEELGSAQVKSALILAAISSGVKLSLLQNKPSRDHTENMLRYCGVPVDFQSGKVEMCPPYNLEARDFFIWGDISSAAFFIVAGLLASEGELYIRNVLLNPYRDRFLNVLKRMGGRIEVLPQKTECGEIGGDILVYPSKLSGTEILPEEIPSLIDELPILTIAGIFADGTFSFRGAHELRVKESDRIETMARNLKNLGVPVVEYEDGLSLNGDPNRHLAGTVRPDMDHRIVMSFEVANARSRANGSEAHIKITGKEWVNTSFPDFYEKWNMINQSISPTEDKGFNQYSGLIVTLDGHAGSGKSTIAKQLASQYGFYQIDSGALYRALTWYALEKVPAPTILESLNHEKFKKFLSAPSWDVGFDKNGLQYVAIDGKRLHDEIRTSKVTSLIKEMADSKDVRETVNTALRRLAHRHFPIVADGRDMGSIVFPEAAVKFFVTADVRERAQRRFVEFQKNAAEEITLEEVESRIRERDRDDENRDFGALKIPDDAIFIDTTSRNIDVAIETVVTILRIVADNSR